MTDAIHVHPLVDFESVVLNVFTRLDEGRDIASAQSVCQSWRRVFRHHSKTHLLQQGTLHQAWKYPSLSSTNFAMDTFLHGKGHRPCMEGKRGISFWEM